MDNAIRKERTHLFSPAINIGFKVDIAGSIDTEYLSEAIKTAVSNHEILRTKIMIDNTGAAYYLPIDEPCISITVSDKSWNEIIIQQEKIRFKLEQGELVRFFIHTDDGVTTLLLYAHHLAGDGLSLAYLAQDILRALASESLKYKPLQLFSMEDLPEGSGLSFISRQLSNMENHAWEKTGKVFTFTDYERIFTSYWNTHRTFIEMAKIEGLQYQNLVSNSQQNGVTINSLLTTALIKAAGERSDVGLAANIRIPGYEGMGNFATGISIQYTYKAANTFLENAKAVQKRIQKKLSDPKKKFFLLQFMGSLEPTLIDAAYFCAYDGYNNSTARQFQKLFGYAGNPKGISVTNLTRLPIQQNYGQYKLLDCTFVPPLVPNGKRVIGVATLGDRMILTLHVEDDSALEDQKGFFHEAVRILRNL